jgi:hypothetical protein
MPDGGSPSLKSQRFHFALSGPRRIHAGRGRADRRAERPDPRGPQEREGRVVLPASRHLGAQFQAPVHARRPRRGQGRPLRERPLVIDLQREIPEAMKPRRIQINGASPSNVTQIEAKAA